MLWLAYFITLGWAEPRLENIPHVKSPRHEIGFACLDIQGPRCRKPMTPGNWKQMKMQKVGQGKVGFAVYQAIGRSLEFRAGEESVWILNDRILEFYPLHDLPYCEKPTAHKWEAGILKLKMKDWVSYSGELKICSND